MLYYNIIALPILIDNPYIFVSSIPFQSTKSNRVCYDGKMFQNLKEVLKAK